MKHGLGESSVTAPSQCFETMASAIRQPMALPPRRLIVQRPSLSLLLCASGQGGFMDACSRGCVMCAVC